MQDEICCMLTTQSTQSSMQILKICRVPPLELYRGLEEETDLPPLAPRRNEIDITGEKNWIPRTQSGQRAILPIKEPSL